MATTALVAELLIIGLEAAGWLALLVLTIFGSDWIDLSGPPGLLENAGELLAVPE